MGASECILNTACIFMDCCVFRAYKETARHLRVNSLVFTSEIPNIHNHFRYSLLILKSGLQFSWDA